MADEGVAPPAPPAAEAPAPPVVPATPKQERQIAIAEAGMKEAIAERDRKLADEAQHDPVAAAEQATNHDGAAKATHAKADEFQRNGYALGARFERAKAHGHERDAQTIRAAIVTPPASATTTATHAPAPLAARLGRPTLVVELVVVI